MGHDFSIRAQPISIRFTVFGKDISSAPFPVVQVITRLLLVPEHGAQVDLPSSVLDIKMADLDFLQTTEVSSLIIYVKVVLEGPYIVTGNDVIS